MSRQEPRPSVGGRGAVQKVARLLKRAAACGAARCQICSEAYPKEPRHGRRVAERGRTRTCDMRFWRAPLYLLSYPPL